MTEAITETSHMPLLKRAGIELSDPEDELHGEIEPRGHMVDVGIGPYEFWGARGRDVRMEFECEDSGTEVITWCQEERPTLGEIGEFTFDTYASDGEEADYEVTVRARLTSFSTKVKRVTVEGERLTYWECEARYEWRVTS